MKTENLTFLYKLEDSWVYLQVLPFAYRVWSEKYFSH